MSCVLFVVCCQWLVVSYALLCDCSCCLMVGFVCCLFVACYAVCDVVVACCKLCNGCVQRPLSFMCCLLNVIVVCCSLCVVRCLSRVEYCWLLFVV